MMIITISVFCDGEIGNCYCEILKKCLSKIVLQNISQKNTIKRKSDLHKICKPTDVDYLCHNTKIKNKCLAKLANEVHSQIEV